MANIRVRIKNLCDDAHHHNIALRLSCIGTHTKFNESLWHSINHFGSEQEHFLTVARQATVEITSACGRRLFAEPVSNGSNIRFNRHEQIHYLSTPGPVVTIDNRDAKTLKKVTIINNSNSCLRPAFITPGEVYRFRFQPTLLASIFSRTPIKFQDCLRHYQIINLLAYESINLALCGGGYGDQARPYQLVLESGIVA